MEYSIVGYGSLISHDSLKESIKNKKFIPVIVKGYKRIFNILSEIGDKLNLKISHSSKFNGVLFKVDEKELKKIKLRENEYNLEETKVYDFYTSKKIGEALISIDYLIDIDTKKRLPNKSYFILCREAAYSISKQFGKFWDKTTYTSEGNRIDKWIKKHKNYDTIQSES